MKFLELAFENPAANLACDEALLEWMETDVSADECLRIWQTTQHFVVLGHSRRLHADVKVAACERDRIPILRRISGGGTVVQGPGCFNYSLLLKADERRLKNIKDTFQFVLERHGRVVAELCGVHARCDGISDLTTNALKFSGNAQYRKSRSVLVHGTFLFDFDLRLLETYLNVPDKQPAYRQGRAHLNFVTNVSVDPARLRDRLKDAWNASENIREIPRAHIDELVRKRYGREEWSEKF